MGHEERKRSLEELPRALRAFLSASDAFDEALGKVLGLNPTDVRCVDLLDQYGTMTAGALAEVAGLSTGAVTFLLDRLERAGFVRRVRDLEDRRRVRVELVPLARDQIFELHAGLAESWRASAQRFSASDLESIISFLREGAKLYEAQVPVLCAQVPSWSGSSTSEGRAAIKAALKAQAKAEALEKLEQTARRLQAKATEFQHKKGRFQSS
ncbi:MAG: MarR family transcriptional regulator [Acidimicrobiales bacterium]|jgi:DNA-binding MarR family transcriptional regulator